MPNQRRKQPANNASIKPVSKSTRNEMGKKIARLTQPPYSFTYEKISLAMGHKSGYAHLIEHGGRVSPTEIERRALDALYTTAQHYAGRLTNDTEKRGEAIGLLSQAMRIVSEL